MLVVHYVFSSSLIDAEKVSKYDAPLSTTFFKAYVLIKLRQDYQQPVKDGILSAFGRVQRVLAVMATGGGKTVVFASIIHDHKGASAAVVHRKEIVVQISVSLARLGVVHRIVAPPATVSDARRAHLEEFGKSFVDASALCGVASVQTLTAKSAAKNSALQSWLKQVTLCVYDEGHHYINSGHWARAVECMKNAKMLQVTACPERADGKGLGAHAAGFAQEMVEGPQARWLIQQGYLSPFKYYAPPSDLNVESIAVSANGDFNAKAFRARVVESHLVGDVVRQYKQFASGKRAIVFATDVATSEEMAARFKSEGVAAMALDGGTPDNVRAKASADFKRGSLLVLVNVDLFDEGYDVPAAECAIIARPTQSLNKFLQMVGRVLRVVYAKGYDISTQQGRLDAIANGEKPTSVIIDPVNNWQRHGMPDWPRQWTLDSREKKESTVSDTVPLKSCKVCTQPYEAFYLACPYCGAVPEQPDRSTPASVEGDLQELDVEAMAALFEKMKAAEAPREEYERGQIARGIPPIGRGADLRRHEDAKYRREVLRNLVKWWVGAQVDRPLGEVHKRFFFRFGIDIATAFTLDAKGTDALIDKIKQGYALDVTPGDV